MAKSMEEAIRDFPTQFAWEPSITGTFDPKSISSYVILGMGGSHLAGDLLSITHPALDLKVWSDYGLPSIPADAAKKTLVIASSYSGNTEEIVDGLKTALEHKMHALVIATGGTLLRMAEEHKLPYIQLPEGFEPRAALGYTFRALLTVIHDKKALEETKNLSAALSPEAAETEGRALALDLSFANPVIYASHKNAPLAYNWKIKFNETGKIPAFWNVFPELNHNEMEAFEGDQNLKQLTKDFYFLILNDDADHPQIKKRMSALHDLYTERGFRIKHIILRGKNAYEKIFQNLMVADFAALTLAGTYGKDPRNVPIIEEFKKRIAQ